MLTAVHPLTRRRLLLGVVGLPSLAAVTAGTSACTSNPPAPGIDPNRAALEGALVIERALLDVVTAWDGADPAQLALSVVVTEHIEALQSALADASESPATPPTPSTPPTPTATTTPTEDAATGDATTDTVRRAADDAADQHTRALRAASAMVTPLLASLAASDAAMAASLRGAGRGVSP